MSEPLRIRREQLGALGRDAEPSRRARLRSHLGARYEGREPSELDALVTLGLARCDDYGLRQMAAILAYAELLAERGPDFDQGPQGARTRQLLRAPELPEPARVAVVSARLVALERLR